MAHNVRAVIFNQKGQFLVVSEVDDSDNFKLPGGKFENDESAQEAIKRELEEELNLSSEYYNLELAAELKTEDEGDKRYIFSVKLNVGVNVDPNLDEIAKFLWVNEASVPEGKNKNHILSAVASCSEQSWSPYIVIAFLCSNTLSS